LGAGTVAALIGGFAGTSVVGFLSDVENNAFVFSTNAAAACSARAVNGNDESCAIINSFSLSA